MADGGNHSDEDDMYGWKGDSNWNYGFLRIKHILFCQHSVQASDSADMSEEY